MTKLKSQALKAAASPLELFADLAQVESELITALDLRDNANYASIYAFNIWCSSDAFIARSDHDMLTKRLEQLSFDADVIKAESDVIVRQLRERKRELTEKLGAQINDEQMQIERENAEGKASEAIRTQHDAYSQVDSATIQAKQLVKPKTKTQLIANAKQTKQKKQAVASNETV
jgi:hypothetical protein